MESVFQDAVVGLRALVRRPSFTLVAVAMLAVGIGANTAIFSVVYAVVLKPLPFDAPEQLHYLGALRGDASRLRSFSAPEAKALRERTRSFQDVATWNEEPFNLVGSGEPERVSGARITASLLPLLGIEPVLGRAFTEEEERVGNDTVVLLGEGAWRRRFAGARTVLGESLQLNGRSYTIVGVVPDVFVFMEPGVELFVPFAFTEHEMDNAGAHFLVALGRLADGVTPEAASAEIDAVMEQATSEFSEDHRGTHGARAAPLHSRLVRDHRQALVILAAAVGFVLLIACANVANLLLARASERRRELSIRAAMGAGQARLVRQLLTESLLLAAMGGSLGLLIALWSVDLVVRMSPSDVPRLASVSIDWSTFLFVSIVSLGAGLLFGILPALSASKGQLERSLNETARGEVTAASGEGSRNALVALEMALALVLLVGAGLTLRSFFELGQVSPGFEAQSLVTARLLLPDSRYEKGVDQAAFAADALVELKSLPGVTEAAIISPLPFSGSAWRIAIEIPGRTETRDDSLSANWRTISPGYFKTMGIPLLAGRDIADQEMHEVEHNGPSVVVVNESFTREVFPGEESLGKTIIVGYNDIVCEIVGIVGDVRHDGLDSESGAEMYTPFAATPLSELSVAVRTAGDPLAIARPIREAVWRVDPEQPVYAIEAMPSLVRDSLVPQRFVMTLMGAFAFVALFLSALGVYAVMSYAVVRRTSEIGIRIALGARSSEILTMVLGQGAKLVAWGSVSGVLASLLLSRFLASQLYGISSTDVGTYAAVALLLVSVAVAAMAIPAYRASVSSPLVALRHD